MPKGKFSENKYLPTSGVRTDFKRFMNSFLASNTVRYEHFSDVWREKNMSYLCAGRNTDREAREFIERVMLIAQEYFLPPFQFQVRVGGLYLLYALYQIQPLVPKVKIRMTPSQWQDTLFFQQQASQQNHLDVVYVFQRLLQEQAFLFCFTTTEMSSYASIKETQDKEENLADSLKEERTAINSLFNYESLEQLSYLQDQYQQMKISLAGPKATKPDNSLDVVQGELVEDLVVLMQTFRTEVATISKQGQKAEEKSEDEEAKDEPTGSRRQTLKAQAYSNITAPARKTHHVVVESSSSVERSPLKAQDSTKLVKEASVAILDAKGPKKVLLNMPILVDEDDKSSTDDNDEDYVPPGKNFGKLVSARKNGAAAKSLPQEWGTGTSKQVAVITARNGEHPGQNKGIQEIVVTPSKRKSQCQQAAERVPGSKYEVFFAPAGRPALSNVIRGKEVVTAPTGIRPRSLKSAQKATNSSFEVTNTPSGQPVLSEVGKGNFSEAVMNLMSKTRKGRNDLSETAANGVNNESRKRKNSYHVEKQQTVTEIRVGKEVGKPPRVQSFQTHAKFKMEAVTGSSTNKSANSFAAFQSIQGTQPKTSHPVEVMSMPEMSRSKKVKRTEPSESVPNGDNRTRQVPKSACTKKSQNSTNIKAIAERSKAGGGVSKGIPPKPVKLIKVVSPQDAIKRLKERCMKSREMEEEPMNEYTDSIIKTGKEETGFESVYFDNDDTPVGLSSSLLEQEDFEPQVMHISEIATCSQDFPASNYPSYNGPKKKAPKMASFRFI